MTLKQKALIVGVAGTLILIADQASKIWARSALVAPGAVFFEDEKKRLSIQVVGERPGVEFRLAFNKGSAFGLFNETSGARVFLSIIGLGALLLIGYLLTRPESDSRLFVWSLAAVAGGAVGNLIDRIASGQVTDFIWVWLTPAWRMVWPWPAFNIADIALVVGVGLMVPAMLFTALPVDGDKNDNDDSGNEGSAKPSTRPSAKAPVKPKTKGSGKKKGRGRSK